MRLDRRLGLAQLHPIIGNLSHRLELFRLDRESNIKSAVPAPTPLLNRARVASIGIKAAHTAVEMIADMPSAQRNQPMSRQPSRSITDRKPG